MVKIRVKTKSKQNCYNAEKVQNRGFLTARRYASAGNRDRNVSVRLSVCLSRAGIVSKRRKLTA